MIGGVIIDKYMSVQESMLKFQLELLGATVYKMKGSIRYVDFCIESIKFKYIYHINRKKDRKSTRLNSSHANISYAVFCLKKKKKHIFSLLYSLTINSP